MRFKSLAYICPGFFIASCCTPIQSNSFPQSVTETHTKTTISGAPSYSTPMLAPASIYQAPVQTMPVPLQLPPVTACPPMQYSAPMQTSYCPPPVQYSQPLQSSPCAPMYQANPYPPQPIMYNSHNNCAPSYQAQNPCLPPQNLQAQPVRAMPQENPCH